jgi:hypothetical protein
MLAAPAARSAERDKNAVTHQALVAPLRAVQKALDQKLYDVALTQLKVADAVKDKSPYETFLIEQFRAIAASGSGDLSVAIPALETVIDSSLAPADAKAKFTLQLISIYFDQKDYANTEVWAQRYFQDGGQDPRIHDVLLQSYYFSNDFASAAGEARRLIMAAQQGGLTPPRSEIEILANAFLKMNSQADYEAALETLVSYYPSTDAWATLIHAAMKKPGYSERLDLDRRRLELATGAMKSPASFTDAAELAISEGLCGEATKILAQGFTLGVLGRGPGADRHIRLQMVAEQMAQQDRASLDQSLERAEASSSGSALVDKGLGYVGYGQYDKGLSLMEAGLRKGGLRHADDDALHLGYAYVMAGHSAKALDVFKSVQGKGAGDLAHLWIVYLQSSASSS